MYYSYTKNYVRIGHKYHKDSKNNQSIMLQSKSFVKEFTL